MIIEVLCEDKSSVPVLSQLISELIEDSPGLVDQVKLYPHRGKGKLPEHIKEPAQAKASSLLDLLPAKIRAYDRVYRRTEVILVVVLDADDQDAGQLYQSIENVIRSESDNKYFVIGIPVEETEAWLLGDRPALMAAYPNLDLSLLEGYKQDSVCHTWEVLARVILGDRAESLIGVGYPAVGIYKDRWARAVSPFMKIKNNESPSYQKFVHHFSRVLSWLKDGSHAQ